MHVLRSARVQTLLAFAFGLAFTSIMLSSAAHGEPLQTQHAVYVEPSASPPAIASTSLQLVAAPMPIALQAAAAPDAGPTSDADVAVPATTPGPAPSPSLTVPPDPIENPGGALDSARSAWRDGGWLGVSLVGVYLLVLVVKRYVSWLNTGRRAVVVAALMTALVTAIATFTGGTPTLAWAINALVAGVLLYLRPEASPAKSGIAG